MKTDTQITGIGGNLIIHSIINKQWKSDWQKFDQENDDGIDGIIHVRKSGEVTGETIYAQVKCGGGYKVETLNRPEFIGINVTQKYINDHRPRWDALNGAVILLFVDDDEKVYWTDLKSKKSYSEDNNQIILVPKKQRFGSHSKGHFKRLGHFYPLDRDLETIRVNRSDLKYLRIDTPLKICARDFYKDWSKSPKKSRSNNGLGEVIVNRSGWRHISRKQRGYDKVFQSWQLLSVAKKIITDIDKAYQITKIEKHIDGNYDYQLKDFISLRAKVIFPNRHQSIVQVILRRKRLYNKATNEYEQKVWFYSVYEPRKGIKVQ